METINDNNYELWLVRYADGELTAAERKDVESWLEAHPEAAEELAFYREAPRLERDEHIRYTAAVQPHTRSIWSKGWAWTAAAAVVLLLLSPLALRLFSGPAEPMQVAQATPPVETRRAASAIPTSQHDDIIADAQPTPSVETRRAASAIPTTQHDDIIADAQPTSSVETRRAASAIPTTPNNEIIADAARRVSTNSADDDIIADARPQPEAEPLLAEAVEEVVPEEPEPEVFVPEVEPLLAEEVATEIEESTLAEPAVEEQHLVYVDNLFTVDSGNVIEQRLLAVNENIKERLQSTYFGRRLARRMPTGDELLDYTSDLRERTPEGVRMMADMVLAYNESNK